PDHHPSQVTRVCRALPRERGGDDVLFVGRQGTPYLLPLPLIIDRPTHADAGARGLATYLLEQRRTLAAADRIDDHYGQREPAAVVVQLDTPDVRNRADRLVGGNVGWRGHDRKARPPRRYRAVSRTVKGKARNRVRGSFR